jgi:cytoskeletal protein RodZ
MNRCLDKTEPPFKCGEAHLEGNLMQSTDRLRMFRSLGLAMAALLLIGGAVFASQAATGGIHKSDTSGPSSSADVNGDSQAENASNGQNASESPEASPEESAGESPDASETENDVEDVNGDSASGSPVAFTAEDAGHSPDAVKSHNESESSAPGASPDEHGGASGQAGGDSSNAH